MESLTGDNNDQSGGESIQERAEKIAGKTPSMLEAPGESAEGCQLAHGGAGIDPVESAVGNERERKDAERKKNCRDKSLSENQETKGGNKFLGNFKKPGRPKNNAKG
jgi:hypothetical protein